MMNNNIFNFIFAVITKDGIKFYHSNKKYPEIEAYWANKPDNNRISLYQRFKRFFDDVVKDYYVGFQIDNVILLAHKSAGFDYCKRVSFDLYSMDKQTEFDVLKNNDLGIEIIGSKKTKIILLQKAPIKKKTK